MALTIKQWFESIEDEIVRELALNYLDDRFADVEVEDISSALIEGFTWEKTAQRHDYWERIYYQYQLKEDE